MRKSELIAILAKAHPHLAPKDMETVVNAVFGEIGLALARGDRVELRGFGAFTVRSRVARLARNPRNGEPVPIDTKRVPFFKTGNILRRRVDTGSLPRR